MCQPIIEVQQGFLQGIERTTSEGKTFYSFREIPYGEPPVGHLRFKDPIPAKGWSCVHDATKIGNVAPQTTLFGDDNYTGDDDCLYLTVHTPCLPPIGILLPVIIYLHGGAYTVGTGNESDFNPEYFVQQGIVVVTINSRLGVMGFLCLKTKDVPGNMGLKDQNLGMKWVKNNIEYLGGDPNNVTLMGFSSGSASVEYQALSPLSHNLYNKIIMQSGTAINGWAKNRKPLEFASRLVELLGGNGTDPAYLYKFISEKSTKDLVIAAKKIVNDNDRRRGILHPFSPVFYTLPDHENFLNEDALEILRKGNYRKVPSICGFAAKEGIFLKQIFQKELQQEIASGQGIEFIAEHFNVDKEIIGKRIQNVYKKRPDDKNIDEFVIDFISDIVFIGGTYAALEIRMKHSPQYFFYFTYDRYANATNTEKGATHGTDPKYLGLSADFEFLAADNLVRKRMIHMWSNFVKTGDPTPDLNDVVNVKWLPATENFNGMDIGENLIMRSEDPWSERRKLWIDIYETA